MLGLKRQQLKNGYKNKINASSTDQSKACINDHLNIRHIQVIYRYEL